jgi:hypothetical protein
MIALKTVIGNLSENQSAKIDRNTFLGLISDKIRNDSAAIKDSIKDSIMHVYSKHDGTEYNR